MKEKYLEYAYEILSIKNKATLPFLPIDEYTEFFEKRGYSIDEDSLEVNGHQHDFWINYTHPELKTITVSGSLFYGDNKMYYEGD